MIGGRVPGSSPRTMRRALLGGAAAIALIVATSASGAPGIAGAATNAEHGVGVVTKTFVDRSRPTPRSGDLPEHPGRTLETTIWYPATGVAVDATPVEDAAPDTANGPYPLIAFAHGLSATPATYEPLLAQLAAAGYVVAAPRFPLSSGGGPGKPDAGDVANQPADVSFLIDKLLANTRADAGPLAGLIAPKAIGLAGHSNGAITALGATAHTCCRDPRIRAVAVLSGAAGPYPGGRYRFTDLPAFLAVHGTADELVPYDGIVRIFNQARGPKVLLTVEGGDHGSSASLSAPAGPSVLATITDFFDGYLTGDKAAIAHLPQDGLPGATTIVAATKPGSRQKILIAPKPKYDRSITVTPRTGLVDGQVVTVHWSGFSPGGVVNILQCGPDRSTGAAGCDLTRGALLHPDPTGEGDVQITIIEGPVGDTICDAKHPGCVIIANDDSSVDPADMVQVPIRFA